MQNNSSRNSHSKFEFHPTFASDIYVTRHFLQNSSLFNELHPQTRNFDFNHCRVNIHRPREGIKDWSTRGSRSTRDKRERSPRDDRMWSSQSPGRPQRTVKRDVWLDFSFVANDWRPSVRMSLMKKAIGGSIHRIREFELEKVTRLTNRIFLVIRPTPFSLPPSSFLRLRVRFDRALLMPSLSALSG